MAKSKKKVDFQKTKLRVGRKIAKNRNLIDTTFKSKKIVLKEQLKHYIDHPDEKAKLDIQQLIKGLDHHNSRKTSSLNKIKQLLDSDNKLAFLHMPTLLRKIGTLTRDKEGDVRREALSVLDVLFCSVPEEQAKTEYAALRSYILCAATHLDDKIRDDSLKLLDLVLDYYPRSICNSRSIFNCMLDFVSHTEEIAKSGVYKRNLTANPRNKITAQQWRVEVLKRLVKMLEVNTNDLNKKDDPSETDSDSFDFNEYSFVVVRHISLEPKTPYSFERSEDAKTDSMNNDSPSIRDFLLHIMTLLDGIWREAIPLIPLGKSDDVISRESADVIVMVSQSLCSIMEWVNALSKQYLPQNFAFQFKEDNSFPIQNYLLPKFPYTINETYRKSQHTWRMGERSQTSTIGVNMLICKVYALYILNTNDCIPSRYEEVLSYLSFVVTKLDSAEFADVSNLLTVLNMFISGSESYDYEPILAPLLKYYKKDTHAKELIRTFFFTLVMEPQLFLKLEKSPTLQHWLRLIVVEFISLARVQEIDDTLINTMKKITCFGLPAFMESLSDNAKKVIGLLCVEDEGIREMAVFLFSRLPTIRQEHFSKLSVAIDRFTLSLQRLDHLFSFLMFRIEKYDSGISQEDFLCFLFNVAMGRTAACTEELVQNQGRVSQSLLQRISNGLFSHVILPSQDWSRERDILDLVVTVLKRIPFEDMLAVCVRTFIEKILSSNTQIPVNRVCGVLQLYTHFLSKNSTSIEVEFGVANLILATCMYEMELFDLTIKDQNKLKFSMQSYLRSCRKNFLEITKVFLENLHLMHAMDTANKGRMMLVKLLSNSSVCSEARILSAFLKTFDVASRDSPECQVWGNQLLMQLSAGNSFL